MDKLQQLRTLVRKRHDGNWEKRTNCSGGNLYWERALEDADILAIIDSIPRFKVGDVIKSGSYTYTIKDMDEDSYILEGDKVLTFNAQYDWELMVTMDEEPVSEDLEEASKEWLRPQLDMSYINYGEGKTMELTHFDGYAMLDAIEFGAKWKEEQMMKNAINAEVAVPVYEGKDIKLTQLVTTDVKLDVGDKVKLILIKRE